METSSATDISPPPAKRVKMSPERDSTPVDDEDIYGTPAKNSPAPSQDGLRPESKPALPPISPALPFGGIPGLNLVGQPASSGSAAQDAPASKITVSSLGIAFDRQNILIKQEEEEDRQETTRHQNVSESHQTSENTGGYGVSGLATEGMSNDPAVGSSSETAMDSGQTVTEQDDVTQRQELATQMDPTGCQGNDQEMDETVTMPDETGSEPGGMNSSAPETSEAHMKGSDAPKTVLNGDSTAPDENIKMEDEGQPGLCNGTGADSSIVKEDVKLLVDPDFRAVGEANKTDQSAEWQLDSSAEDSSDTSTDSSDSSDEDSSDEDYPLLDPAEQARILMNPDSDDEGGSALKKAPRTRNEEDEPIMPKPDVTITAEMPIIELGSVHNVVDNFVLIKANVTGEYRVLDSGSVLCLPDKQVIGAVAEPFGRVEEPFYSVGFRNADEITSMGITLETTVFYTEQFANYVFTKPLRSQKYTDASNDNDEELGEEMDFSDDEAELAYKQAQKRARRERHTGNQPGPRPAAARYMQDAPIKYELSYDDDVDDSMYTPLSRPDNLHQMMGPGWEPTEDANGRGYVPRGSRAGGGRARAGRGRGDRGGRGNKPGRSGRNHRDRGGHQEANRSQHSPSRHEPASTNYPAPSHTGSTPYQPWIPNTPNPVHGLPLAPTSRLHGDTWNPSPSSLGFMPSEPHFSQYEPPASPFMSEYGFGWNQTFSNAASYAQSPSPATTGLPSGSFLNPAFFNAQQGSPQVSPPPSQPGQFNQQWTPFAQSPPLPPPPPPPQQQALLEQLASVLRAQSQAAQSGGQQASSPPTDAAFQAAQAQLDILRGLRRNP